MTKKEEQAGEAPGEAEQEEAELMREQNTDEQDAVSGLEQDVKGTVMRGSRGSAGLDGRDQRKKANGRGNGGEGEHGGKGGVGSKRSSLGQEE